MTKEVAFEPVTGAINERIDDAYRAKYSKSPCLDPMIAARAGSATVKVIPRTKERKCPEKQRKAKIERIADQF
jgi:hypothetical protein